jgi:hypothetical protein
MVAEMKIAAYGQDVIVQSDDNEFIGRIEWNVSDNRIIVETDKMVSHVYNAGVRPDELSEIVKAVR